MSVFFKIFAFFLFPMVAFSAVTSQILHTCFLLAIEGHPEKTYEVLLSSFEKIDSNTEFLSDQFVKWSIKEDCSMEPELNNASYFIIRNNRKEAVSSIENRFDSYSKDVHDFSEAFYEWGVSLFDLKKLIERGQECSKK